MIAQPFQRPILAASLISSSFNFAFFLLTSLLLSSGNLSVFDVSWILGIANLVSALLQPVVGILVDYGQLWTVSTLAFLLNAAGIFMLDSNSAKILTLGSSLVLLGAAVVQTITSRSIEGLATPNSRAELASLNYLLSNIGYAISATLAFFFLTEYKKILLGLDVLTTGIGCVLIALYGNISQNKSNDSKLKLNYFNFIGENPAIWLAMFSTLPIFMALASSFSIVQIAFENKGLDYSRYSTVLIGVSSGVVAAGYFLMQVLKPGSFVKIVVGGTLLGIGVTLFNFTTNFVDCFIYTVIWSIGEILVIGKASSCFYSVAPKITPGLAAGIKVATIRFAFVICPLLIAFFGSVTTWKLFAFISMPCVFGALVLFNLDSRFKNQKT